MEQVTAQRRAAIVRDLVAGLRLLVRDGDHWCLWTTDHSPQCKAITAAVEGGDELCRELEDDVLEAEAR